MNEQQHQEWRAQTKAREEQASAHHKTFFKEMLKELETHFGITFPKSTKDYLRQHWTEGSGRFFQIKGGMWHFIDMCSLGETNKAIRKLAYIKTPKRMDTGICIDKPNKGKSWLLNNHIIKANKWQLVSGTVSEYVLTSIPEGWIAPKTPEEERSELAESLAKWNEKTKGINETLKSMDLL